MVPAKWPIGWPAASLLLLGALGGAIAGCPRQRGLDEAVLGALTAADIAWRDRGTSGLPAVGTALDAAEAMVPGHPEIGWRRVRLGIATGLAEEDRVGALRAFSSARDAGLVCVLGPDVVVKDLTVVLRGVEAARAPCVAWTALAWVRWLVAFGPEGAALDLPRIDRLLTVAVTGPSLTGPHDHVVDWADGLLSAVRPDAPDPARAADRLSAVARDHADDSVVLLDWLLLVAEPQGQTDVAAELTESLRQADLDTPEERGTVGAWRTRSVGAP